MGALSPYRNQPHNKEVPFPSCTKDMKVIKYPLTPDSRPLSSFEEKNLFSSRPIKETSLNNPQLSSLCLAHSLLLHKASKPSSSMQRSTFKTQRITNCLNKKKSN